MWVHQQQVLFWGCVWRGVILFFKYKNNGASGSWGSQDPPTRPPHAAPHRSGAGVLPALGVYGLLPKKQGGSFPAPWGPQAIAHLWCSSTGMGMGALRWHWAAAAAGGPSLRSTVGQPWGSQTAVRCKTKGMAQGVQGQTPPQEHTWVRSQGGTALGGGTLRKC